MTDRRLREMSKAMDLNWKVDDLQTGAITREEVVELLQHGIAGPEADAGYRSIHQALAIRGIRIRRDTIDPEGVALRHNGKLRHRRFYCSGPNYIWSSDGHDKLQPYGITIYGFIDAWSCRVLRFDVGITNNEPRRVAYHYLQIVKEVGGIPVQTCTDHGSATVEMAGLQICFSRRYGGATVPEVKQAHIFTSSPHNQKIESLWSLIRKRKGHRIHRH
ncbi:hypothetical protein CROQUDRAFT_723580 [Cronartium quercuum f. sp. fusiforme G11]|uniref:Integrase core domain-containing protein n=1 Tax=Cronartium quercuum f. sp. fusiforme G11 TaxID=708437 RepID=A0A9P6TB13_9BASI|nr:hypothetical protein CROQUDRAFT_723580 [Cronartium quercuum f. sp. fusiforme G11]